MAMLEQRIQQQFFDSADLQYQTAESLARPIAEAVAAVVGAITAGGKIMLCGQDGGEALADARLLTVQDVDHGQGQDALRGFLKG